MKVPGLPYWLCSQYGTLHLSLMCRVPNIVHIIMDFVFAPLFFVHFNQISAETKVCGTPYEMEVPRLPYWPCSQCDTLHLSFNVSNAKRCSYSYEFCFCPIIFRAFYLNFDSRECRVILSYWHYHTRCRFIKTNRRKCRVIRSNWHQHSRSTFFNVAAKNVSFVS